MFSQHRTKRSPRGRLGWPASACRWISLTLLLGLASPCVLTSSWLAAGEPIVYRSTRMDLPRRLDELDLPRYGNRQCHWGWETRTKHFVVFATTSKEDAQWAAAEMEAAWNDLEDWAQYFTDAQERPTFGIGAVNVLITNEWVEPQAAIPAGPDKMNYRPDIRMKVNRGTSDQEQQRTQLRTEATRAFFRVAQLDQAVPDWVQVGMAAYLSGQALPSGTIAKLPPPPATTDRRGAWSRRTTADQADLGELNPQWAGLWIAYLIEGDDASHLPAFLQALSETVTHRQEDPFEAAAGVSRPRRSNEPLIGMPGDPIGKLARSLANRNTMGGWLLDRRAGQPTLDPEADAPEIERYESEIAFILKLLARFGMPGPVSVVTQFRATGDGDEGATTLSSPSTGQSLRSLYTRLTDPRRPAWATLGPDGRPLLGSEKERLAEILVPAASRYRVYQQDDRYVLRGKLPNGTQVEAWLDANEENPTRPLMRVVRKAPDDGSGVSQEQTTDAESGPKVNTFSEEGATTKSQSVELPASVQ